MKANLAVSIPTHFRGRYGHLLFIATFAIGFGFVSHRLNNWRESFKAITKSSNRNQVINYFR